MSGAQTTPKSISLNQTIVRVNDNDSYHFNRWQFGVAPENTREDDNQGHEPNSTQTGFRPTLELEYNGQQADDFRDAFYLPNTFIPRPKGDVEVICVSPRMNVSCQWVLPDADTTEAVSDSTLNNSFTLLVDRPRRLQGTGSLTTPQQPQPGG